MAQAGGAGGFPAGQLAQILTAARPGRKLEPFSTGLAEDWLVWRANFVTTATINGWSNQRQRREISASMQGSAKLRTAAIPIADDYVHPAVDAAPAAGLLDAYEAVFIVAADSDLARTSFLRARQGPEESTLEWHGRLRTLFNRAYPGMTAVQTNNSRDLRETFLRGLRNATVGKDAWQRRPADYQAALDLASDAEAAAALWGEGRRQVNSMDHLDSYGPPPSGDINALNAPRDGCWNCGGNHYRRECPADYGGQSGSNAYLNNNYYRNGNAPRGSGSLRSRGGSRGGSNFNRNYNQSPYATGGRGRGQLRGGRGRGAGPTSFGGRGRGGPYQRNPRGRGGNNSRYTQAAHRYIHALQEIQEEGLDPAALEADWENDDAAFQPEEEGEQSYYEEEAHDYYEPSGN